MTGGNMLGSYHGEYYAPRSNYADSNPDTHTHLLRDRKNALVEQ